MVAMTPLALWQRACRCALSVCATQRVTGAPPTRSYSRQGWSLNG
jgi:hypothetical protein